MKSVVLFLATFIVGAALALGARTALHKPYAEPVNGAAVAAHDLKSQISNLKSDGSAVVNTVCAMWRTPPFCWIGSLLRFM